jgi:ATP-binding cassette subfamily C (CFTR/MRP) protein 1
MLNNIMRLPQSFFDVTPLGRVLNRFSKDQNCVDEVLPRTFHMYARTLFGYVRTLSYQNSVITVLSVNVFSNPFFLLFAAPLGFLYIFFQRYYLTTSRELKRLDSVSRSPVYAHFQETLGGLQTIRAYKQQARFTTTNEDRVDYNQRAAFPSISSNRWLGLLIFVMCSCTIGVYRKHYNIWECHVSCCVDSYLWIR